MKKNKTEIYKEITSFLKSNGAKRIAVFGSYARNEEASESDIDIIVEFREKKTLLDFIGMEQDLSEMLGIQVDLLTERSLSPYLAESVKEEMEVIYQ